MIAAPSAPSLRKTAIRFGRLGGKIKPPKPVTTPTAGRLQTPTTPNQPTTRSRPRWGRRAGIGAGIAAPAGAAAGGHAYLQGEGGQDWLYNRAWGGLSGQEKTDRALEYLEQDQAGGPQGYFANQVGDETRGRIRSEATQHMMDRGIRDVLGMGEDEGGTGQLLMQNWKQYLPILLGLGLGAGGIARRSPMMGLLGLLAGGYGLKSIYDKGQTLKEKGPELMLMASGRTGSKIEQDAAKKRLRELYGATAPAYKMMNTLGISPGFAKTGGAMNHLMDHFHTSKMVEEIRKDRGVDSRTAAEMITALKNAQRVDSRPKSVISVGEFATGAAGTALGFTLGARLGSLMSLRPAAKGSVSRFGQGLFSGADKLGVI